MYDLSCDSVCSLEHSESVVTADLAAPADVRRILRTACYDGHSNEKRLEQFDEVAPADRLAVKRRQGRPPAFEFSPGSGTSLPRKRMRLLFEAVNQIPFRVMAVAYCVDQFLPPGACLANS